MSDNPEALRYLATWHTQHLARRKNRSDTAMPKQTDSPASNERAMTKYQLPASVQAGTPANTAQAESLVNAIIVVRGMGARINAKLGPCYPIFFQFPGDYEDVGPQPLTVNRDANGSLYATCPPQSEKMGVYQFLASESSATVRVAREITAELPDTHGLAARTAVMRTKQSATNPGFTYYVFDEPTEEDVYAQAEIGN